MLTSDPGSCPATVRRFVEDRFSGAIIDPLAGDVSTRRYFRITPAAAFPPDPGSSERRSPGLHSTCVLSLYSRSFTPGDFPFLETTRLFEAIDLPVPRVLEVDAEAGIILLADLGDCRLQSALLRAPGSTPAAAGSPGSADRGHLQVVPAPEEVDRYYREAVEIIVRIQRDGTPRLSEAIHAGREALDASRLRLELDFFVEHLIQRLAGGPLARDVLRRIEAAFDVLCAVLRREPRVLCHRDFHSRNLMVGEDGRLGIVDHQDARRGPDTYDLVSLLQDPYVPVPEARVGALLGHYLALRESSENLDSLQARFDRMAVQRLLKAAGTFAAQKTLHGRDTHLPYLSPALSRARSALGRCEELEPLRDALAPVFALFPEPSS